MRPVTEVLYQCYEVFCLPGTWRKHRSDDGYRVCAGGAIELAAPDWSLRIAASAVLERAIREDRIGYWNDHRRRTQDQVRDAFLQAAKLSEES